MSCFLDLRSSLHGATQASDANLILIALTAYLWNQRHLLCQPVIQIDPEFARFIMDQQEMAQAHFCTISKLPYHAQKFLIWSACGMDEDFYNLFYEHYDPITVGNTNNQDTYARIALKLGVRPKSLCLYSADEEGEHYTITAMLIHQLIPAQMCPMQMLLELWQLGVIYFESGLLKVRMSN